MAMESQTFFSAENRVAPLGIVPLAGARELSEKVEAHLVRWAKRAGMDVDTFIIENSCPRFSSGDSKGLIKSTVRGYDLFFVVDVGNYSLTYNYFGNQNHMSPDDHYQDLKRLIQAASGKAHRVNVVMPLLYGGRQHRRSYRESLDCAYMLQELQQMGVSNVLTFDAHDPRVQNAVPVMGFDNLMPTYQVLKKLFKDFPDLSTDKKDFMIVSPDEGALNRNMYYASVLGVDMGMFYKYAIFTNGLAKFDKAYEEGLIDGIFGSNLTYLNPELKNRPWFHEVDVSKYIAYFISALNHDASISSLLDPHAKIDALLQKRALEKAKIIDEQL